MVLWCMVYGVWCYMSIIGELYVRTLLDQSCTLNLLTSFVLDSIVIKGFKKTLERKDLWSLNPKDTSKVVCPKFDKEWEKELAKHKR